METKLKQGTLKKNPFQGKRMSMSYQKKKRKKK
jgi:hypothetical protein